MLVEQLTRVYENLCNTTCYLIGSHRVSCTVRDDFYTLCNGLALWCGVLLDFDDWLVLNARNYGGQRGRIISMMCSLAGQNGIIDLTPLLTFLDQSDDCLIKQLADDVPFKGVLSFETKAPTHFGVVKGMIKHSCLVIHRQETLRREGITLLHQVFSLLHKLSIDRPDLKDDAFASFFEFEEHQCDRDRLLDEPETLRFIKEMNELALTYLNDWKPLTLLPRHGPGVVSTSGVHSRYEKYLRMSTDRRIDHLLSRDGLGTEADYNPWVNPTRSDRTSRFIPVPKTWKKLRGISAEPIELQFYQQAIFRSIDEYFHSNSFWRCRVNLHDQSVSRELALLGSIHDGYATIDLSAASDSVSLELVKRVLKGTHLLHWLLGTRSTHSTCNGVSIRLGKFSPMGSACCFPLECIIFTLAAQVASNRTRSPHEDSPCMVRVFGDDIIIDWYAAPLLCDFLQRLGFEVNLRKSYLRGSFREACGVEAYRGWEIQPWRFKALRGKLTAWRPVLNDVATAISYCNSCYDRGLHNTRQFLLQCLLNGRIVIGRKAYKLSRYLPFTLDGLKGTLKSSYANNFNLVVKAARPSENRKVPFYGYPTYVSLGCRLRDRSSPSMVKYSSYIQDIQYHEWLMNHTDSYSEDQLNDDTLITLDTIVSDLWDASSAMMIPTLRSVPMYPRLLETI